MVLVRKETELPDQPTPQEQIRRLSRLVIELEREVVELRDKLAIELAREKCSECGHSWDPALVEGGSCIFCILKGVKTERDDALRRLTEYETHVGQPMLKHLMKSHALASGYTLSQVSH